MATPLSVGDKKILCRVETEKGTFEAFLFSASTRRLKDTLNDQRFFIPMMKTDDVNGPIQMVNKNFIISICEV